MIAVIVTAMAMAGAAPAAQAYVYWTDIGTKGLLGSGGTTLERANLDGNGINPSFVSGASSPGPIVVQGSYVDWGNSNGVSTIGRVASDGSGVDQTFVPGTLAAGIATDGTYLYWTDGNRYVGRANLDGTGANPQFIDMGLTTAPFGIAAYGGKLYIGESGEILDVSATGSGGSTVLVSGLGGGSAIIPSITIANGYLYFADITTPAGSSSIGRVPLAGPPAKEGFIPNLQFPTGVASDGTHLYWVDHGTGSIGRADITSSSPTDLRPSFITDSGGPFGIAVDPQIDPTATSVSCTPSIVATAKSRRLHRLGHGQRLLRGPNRSRRLQRRREHVLPRWQLVHAGAPPGRRTVVHGRR